MAKCEQVKSLFILDTKGGSMKNRSILWCPFQPIHDLCFIPERLVELTHTLSYREDGFKTLDVEVDEKWRSASAEPGADHSGL